jgi:hypothetical protein
MYLVLQLLSLALEVCGFLNAHEPELHRSFIFQPGSCETPYCSPTISICT